VRELTNHKVNGLNDALNITVLDGPGAGGACHRYRVEPTIGNAVGVMIEFQKGPLGENPPNGLSNEALLAIVEDRLTGFQGGKFACHENQMALDSVRAAMQWLRDRTARRVAAGIEGTLTK
jgi:hypothetical protein